MNVNELAKLAKSLGLTDSEIKLLTAGDIDALCDIASWMDDDDEVDRHYEWYVEQYGDPDALDNAA